MPRYCCVAVACSFVRFANALILLIDSSTGFADCTTGEVRLVDFTDNPEEDSRQGTIQICVNNAWGSVCNDHFFDRTDAEVFCDQLVGFSTDGIEIELGHSSGLILFFRRGF